MRWWGVGLVRCPTRWPLYLPLALCIDHLSILSTERRGTAMYPLSPGCDALSFFCCITTDNHIWGMGMKFVGEKYSERGSFCSKAASLLWLYLCAHLWETSLSSAPPLKCQVPCREKVRNVEHHCEVNITWPLWTRSSWVWSFKWGWFVGFYLWNTEESQLLQSSLGTKATF